MCKQFEDKSLLNDQKQLYNAKNIVIPDRNFTKIIMVKLLARRLDEPYLNL